MTMRNRIRDAERRSLQLHAFAARRLLDDPDLVDVVLARLTVLGRVNPQGAVYHTRWLALLSDRTPAGLARLAETMIEESESAAALRRESPFTVLVPKTERARIFRTFKK